jgi:hypothetical protein
VIELLPRLAAIDTEGDAVRRHSEPHYARDYGRLMQTMRRREATLEGAILRTTGAADLDFGSVELSILNAAGLREIGYVIDVGCGLVDCAWHCGPFSTSNSRALISSRK